MRCENCGHNKLTYAPALHALIQTCELGQFDNCCKNCWIPKKKNNKAADQEPSLNK